MFGVKQGSVGTGSNFIDRGGFEIEKDAAWDKFTRTSFREKSVVTVVIGVIQIVVGGGLWFLSVWLNSVFQAEQFPAGITDLDTGLTEVDKKTFAHVCRLKEG